MEKEVLIKLAKSQEGSLNFISKDMATLARMLKKTSPEDEEKFQANLVQGSFYLTAYTMAVKAFNKMVDEKNTDPTCETTRTEYFLEEILKIQKEEMEIAAKEKGEDNDH